MRPRAVLCGSYHLDPIALKRLFKELEITGCRILSPISLDFSDLNASVVAASSEADLSLAEIETFHLRAIRDADFVMLHAPGGHVGTSSSYELGYASALNKPVYCLNRPNDEMLAARIKQASSVFEILDQLKLTYF